MSTPSFTAELSLTPVTKYYRLTANPTPYSARHMVLPQWECEWECEEWGCNIRCEQDERPE